MSFAAEAQIARELMKFAANGTLYRGSKPVMWSVVEKTALAEAEVEYEDYVSDQVWVKFPVAFAFGDRREGRSIEADCERLDRHLDDDAVDIPGNRAISYLAARSPTASTRSPTRQTDNWAKAGDQLILADKLAADVIEAGARRQPSRSVARGAGRRSRGAWSARIRCKASSGYRVRRAAARRRSRHRRGRHRLRAHRARPRPRGLRHLDRERARARSARHQHGDPLHGRRERRVHRAGAGLHRQARHHRQGREGRRQRGGDQGAGRGRHADRARPAEAPVSAFVALEEAGDLPQHAAMVHRDGSSDIVGDNGDETRRHAAPSRARRDRSRPAGSRRRARTASPA